MDGPLRSRVPLAAALVVLAVAAACSKGPPPTPSPGPGNGDSITGRERLGWDQPAADPSELATFRYAIYVDGARSEIADASCATSAGTGGFPCSGPLPTMSNGAHTLELTAFIDAGGIIESARSSPLRVTVTGVAAGQTPSIADGDIATTTDGVRLRLDVLYGALVEPSSLAVTGDGRVMVGGRGGVVTVTPEGVTESLPAGAVVAIALSPTHERDGFVYLTHAVDMDGESPDLKVGPTGFLTARYRDVRSRLGERMVVLEHGPSSRDPAAALRVGPDGKLYAAFDNGGRGDAPRPVSDWSGTLLRMELDGRTPDDQAAASPVMRSGLQSPGGFDWAPGGSELWIADVSTDGVERLRVIDSTGERPRRAAQRAVYVLPRGLGAAGVAFYGAGVVEEFSGDLFVAGRDAGYILRIRFDAAGRPATTERLLEGRAGTVRALAVGTDGGIYFCTDTLLGRLRRAD